MTISINNLCYGCDSKSKISALNTIREFFESLRKGGYVTYIPVSNNGNTAPKNINEGKLTDVVFVSVETLTPEMQAAFQNSKDMETNRVRSLFNGIIWDYAANMVKDFLQDENSGVVRQAIDVATEYRLCSMSRMPYPYSHVRHMNLEDTSEVKACGKVLSAAIG
jgi:hypothetical protein